MVLVLARAPVGVAVVFVETHPDPDKAPSDGATMLPLRIIDGLIRTLQRIDLVAKST